MREHEYRLEILRYGKMLHERGLIAATDGNISVRLNASQVLTTPTCICKGMMTVDDLLVVDMHGRRLSGFRDVTSEIAMHMTIYRMRPDVQAIVHAHPPTATGFAACGLALDQALISEVLLSLGTVPLAKYATPGTNELSESLAPYIPDHDAVLMANHGVVTYGSDLTQAYMNMETVEHFARIALVVKQLGCERPLAPEQVDKLHEIRQRIQLYKLEMRSRA
ncbi:MAG: class II aldolase/adducin family protein [Acidobacteriota bacterium]|nr:class II aldolase/adducin family protein [Acidobacteriota bacterium]